MQAAPDQNFGLRMMLNFALIIPIFYFLLIRPQMKERKRHDAMVEGVKKGDEIVTTGGIIGKIIHADGNRLTVRTGEDTRITVDMANAIGAFAPVAERCSALWAEASKKIGAMEDQTCVAKLWEQNNGVTLELKD